MTGETYRNHAAELRHYIDLIESQTVSISVTVDGYVGIVTKPEDGSPFPANFQFDVAMGMNKDAVSKAVAAEIQKSTGYEPKRFRWRWKQLNPVNLC